MDQLQSPKAIDLVWSAWCELNRIRARDGAPEGVCPDYFSELVEGLRDILPEQYRNPWHPRIVRAREETNDRA